MPELFVMDPRGELVEKEKKLCPRVSTLKGKVIGLISSGSGNSTEFLKRLGEVLKEKYQVADVVLEIKASVATPLPPEKMKGMLKRCRVVVAGVGVGGSNTLSLVVDAINAEMAGIPGIAIVGSDYEKAARAKIRNMAFPDLDYVMVPTPMGAVEEAHQKAERALEDVVAIATKGRREA